MFEDYKWLSPKFKRTQAIVKPMLKMLEKEGVNLKVLDIGCGNGVVTELISQLNNKVWGIDENPKALKEARQRGIKTFQVELEKNLPFENDFFDVLWCSRTLEHVFNTEHFLKECYRILKVKGIILITADNICSFVNRIRVFFGLYPLRVSFSENERFAQHVRCFNKKTFVEIIKRTGFFVEKITSDFICFNPRPYNSPPWSTSLGKIIPSLGETLIIKARKTEKH